MRLRDEAGGVERDRILAKRDGLEFEDAIGIGVGFLFVSGIDGRKHGMGAADWTMLRIVNDTADVAEDSGKRGGSCK